MSDERRGRRRSYRPGEWYAVFGDRATVLLPPTQRSRVAQLWPLLDDGAGFDEVLDALIATGLRGLPGFVLVSESDDETRIVLRGAARAVLSGAEGDVELAGSAATTWVERSVHGVTRLVVEVGPDGAPDDAGDNVDEDAAELPLCTDGGVARVRRVDQPPYRPTAAAPVPAPAPEPAPVAVPVPASDAQPDTEPDAQPEPELRPEPERGPERAAAWSPAPVPLSADDADAPTEAIQVSARGWEADDDADRVTDRFAERDQGDERPGRPAGLLQRGGRGRGPGGTGGPGSPGATDPDGRGAAAGDGAQPAPGGLRDPPRGPSRRRPRPGDGRRHGPGVHQRHGAAPAGRGRPGPARRARGAAAARSGARPRRRRDDPGFGRLTFGHEFRPKHHSPITVECLACAAPDIGCPLHEVRDLPHAGTRRAPADVLHHFRRGSTALPGGQV